MVAEWRYAEVGVGAAMAPGSQAWNGAWARLGERTHQDEHEARPTTVDPLRRVGEDRADRRGAGRLTDQHEAAQHRQATGAGDEQGLAWPRSRAASGRRRSRSAGTSVIDVSSQNRYSANRLSAITRPNIAPPNATSSEAVRTAFARGEVGPGVHADEHADAGHEAQHQEREAGEPEREVEAERGNPFDLLGDGASVGDLPAGPRPRPSAATNGRAAT